MKKTPVDHLTVHVTRYLPADQLPVQVDSPVSVDQVKTFSYLFSR